MPIQSFNESKKEYPLVKFQLTVKLPVFRTSDSGVAFNDTALPSSSLIFTVAEFGAPTVYAAFADIVRVAVSDGSTVASFIGVIVRTAEACPAGIVIGEAIEV